jgi:hypothetical protein
MLALSPSRRKGHCLPRRGATQDGTGIPQDVASPRLPVRRTYTPRRHVSGSLSIRGYDRTEWMCLLLIAGTIVVAPFFHQRLLAFAIIVLVTVVLVHHMFSRPG